MSKILINTHSFQTIPNYIAIKEVLPDKVIALTTQEYVSQVLIFNNITKVKHQKVDIDAYDLENNIIVIKHLLATFDVNDEIIINYTGGTKIMAVSLILQLLLSAKQKLSFVYVNTQDNKLEYLQIDKTKNLITRRVIIDTKVLLDTSVMLRNEKIKMAISELTPDVEERFELSESLLLDRNLIGIFSIQKSFFERVGNRNVVKESFEKYTAKYDIEWDEYSFRVVTDNDNYEYNHSDGGLYFSGAWLEEYVFYQLIKNNEYDEVLASVKFDFTSLKGGNDKVFKNEIDVVVTKGLKTVFIECKAGYVTQDYVYKLKTIRDHFLGTFGKAILLTKFPQKENDIEKCNDANIKIVSGGEIVNIVSIVNELIK